MKIALIVGITVQDVSCAAEILSEKNYPIHGQMRRTNSFNT